MKSIQIKVGDHFWCLTDENKLIVGLKTKRGIYVCGNWEGIVSESELKIIELIEKPKMYENTPLYYNQ
jgi:hypothetical protein